VTRIAFSPDGRTLVSCGEDATVRIWNAENGKTVRLLSGHDGAVRCVTFSPKGNTIVSGGLDRTVRVWEAASGRQLRVLAGHTAAVTCAVVSPNNQLLATGGDDRTVRLWDLESGEELHSEKEHAQPVLAVAFAPGGWSLVSGAADGTLLWCDLATCTSRMVPNVQGQPLEQLAFSPDGLNLRVLKRATAINKTVDGVTFFFDAVTALSLQAGVSPRPRADVLENASSATLSPDGRIVLIGSQPENGRMRMTLWDTDSRRELVHFQAGHNGGVSPQPTCAISPDGRRAAYSDPNSAHAPILIVRLPETKTAGK
jgi:WD40 repeat protein